MREGVNEMANIGHYQAFSMEILSEIPLQLPQFTTASMNDASQERVWITYGSVRGSFKLEHTIGRIEYGRSDDHSEIMMHIPWIADISIGRGNCVVVEPAAGFEEPIVAQFIVGLVLIFILKRKRLVTVHGSAVSTGAEAIVLMGDRGSGKSTTAAVLVTHGSHMMCDDIVPIGPDGAGKSKPIVFPGIPRPKLRDRTYRELFGDSLEMRFLFDGIDKYQVPIETHIGSFPLHLACILREDIDRGDVNYRQLRGSEKIAQVMHHVSVLPGIESRQEIFAHALRIFQDIRVYEIRRPIGVSTVSQVVSLIEILSKDA